jgi:hypothetical protein
MLWLSRNPRTNRQKKRPNGRPQVGLGNSIQVDCGCSPSSYVFNWLEVDTSAGEHEVEVLQGRIDPLAS